MKTILLLSSLLIGQLTLVPASDYSGNWSNTTNGITMEFEQQDNILSCHFRTKEGYDHRAEGPVWTSSSGQRLGRWLLKRTAPNGCVSFIECRLTFLSETKVRIAAAAVDTNCDLPETWRDVTVYGRQ